MKRRVKEWVNKPNVISVDPRDEHFALVVIDEEAADHGGLVVGGERAQESGRQLDLLFGRCDEDLWKESVYWQ